MQFQKVYETVRCQFHLSFKEKFVKNSFQEVLLDCINFKLLKWAFYEPSTLYQPMEHKKVNARKLALKFKNGQQQ